MSARNWRVWQVGLAAVLAVGGGVGCHGSPKLPTDPLFAGKKPITAQAELGPPLQMAYAEPIRPLDPGVALGVKTPAPTRPQQTYPTRTVPGLLTIRPDADPAYLEGSEPDTPPDPP